VKILYAATKYDNGNRAQGHSFEHYNFCDSLLEMGHDLLYFDFVTLLRERGRDAMNQRLLDVARSERPDLMFTVLLRDELDRAIVRRISTGTSTLTINWFCDDHWRFESFSRYWAPQFNWVITTAASALPKYQALGYRNVIKSQWACNPDRYRPLEFPKKHDVTFIGAPHGDRRFVIDEVRKAGIDVRAWGQGWERGRIDQDDMIRIFSESRINLNLSNSSPTRSLGGRAIDLATLYVQRSPVAPSTRESIARRLAILRQRLAVGNAQAYSDQIKGRNFEIPGCEGFLLTGRVDNLEDFYVPEREVACFTGVGELIRKIHHYLQRADEREAIARAGYERTMREHTYRHRFADIFRQVGLPMSSATKPEPERLTRGSSQDIR
jgi:spore maturation protein CgeB